MKRSQALARLDDAWTEFEQSFAGLSAAQLVIPGVTGQWSVRDIIAHVTWWEEEALKHLPLVRRADDGAATESLATRGSRPAR
jgi:hypothetical protein